MTNFNRSTTIFSILLACTTNAAFGATNERRNITAPNDDCLDPVAAFLDIPNHNNLAKVWKQSFGPIAEQPLRRIMAKIVMPTTISYFIGTHNEHTRDITPDQAQKARVMLARAILYKVLQPGEVEKDANGMYSVPNGTMQNLLLAISDNETLGSGVEKSNVFVVIRELANKADPDQEVGDDGYQKPLLGVACGKQHAGIVKLLLQYGANPNAGWGKKVGHNTCLCTAVTEGNIENALLLLNCPGFNSIDAAGLAYFTALHVACYLKDMALAKLLLQHGANPNLLTGSGKTALLLVCSGGNAKMVARLLKHNADPAVRSSEGPFRGKTALQIARELKHQDCVELLENHAMQMQDSPAPEKIIDQPGPARNTPKAARRSICDRCVIS